MTGPDPHRAQRVAADPGASVWVGASAGTGKTKVLTDRVLALMLAGSDPGRILCLTFTKAAAAEMSNRLNTRLAQWAVAPDGALAESLTELLGRAPDKDLSDRARRLFARVLDTPGGMKIETLHAFCQSLLRRFPIEARCRAPFRRDGRAHAIGGAGRGARPDAVARAPRRRGAAGRSPCRSRAPRDRLIFDSLLATLIDKRARLGARRGIAPTCSRRPRGSDWEPRRWLVACLGPRFRGRASDCGASSRPPCTRRSDIAPDETARACRRCRVRESLDDALVAASRRMNAERQHAATGIAAR